MTCRNCGATLSRIFCDLGTSPLSNSYITEAQLDEPEPRWPLRPYLCESCLLVQLPVFETPERIFGDYAFFSGQSQTWRDHCEKLAASAVNRFGLDRTSRVLEIASNDGVLLRHLMRWTPNVVGVEPARNIARYALLRGLPTICRFFDSTLARELIADGYQADLIVANNVLAHVPDLDDFLLAITEVLAPDGVLSIEVPDLANLITENQFDTIYHEHFSYFTVGSATDALRRRGLQVFNVQPLPTHGGSLRVEARLGLAAAEDCYKGSPTLDDLYAYERQPAQLKERMREAVGLLRHEGRRIAGYGAPAKATTFLTYCGIDHDVIEFIVDSTPAKQGLYQPGARIPILPPEALAEREPDVILILPWNWRDEIAAKIARECPWGPMVLCRDEVLTGALAEAA